MARTVRQEALAVAHSIRALPLEDQGRVLKLVELMLLARDDARRRAQAMIREIETGGPEARDQCLASIDDTIRYLEQHTATAQLI